MLAVQTSIARLSSRNLVPGAPTCVTVRVLCKFPILYVSAQCRRVFASGLCRLFRSLYGGSGQLLLYGMESNRVLCLQFYNEGLWPAIGMGQNVSVAATVV